MLQKHASFYPTQTPYLDEIMRRKERLKSFFHSTSSSHTIRPGSYDRDSTAIIDIHMINCRLYGEDPRASASPRPSHPRCSLYEHCRFEPRSLLGVDTKTQRRSASKFHSHEFSAVREWAGLPLDRSIHF